MPYLTQPNKDALEAFDILPAVSGELNYALTKLCIDYIEFVGLRYATINAVVGALECAKQEFYARVARPYEDAKIRENGDVYPESMSPPTPPWNWTNAGGLAHD